MDAGAHAAAGDVEGIGRRKLCTVVVERYGSGNGVGLDGTGTLVWKCQHVVIRTFVYLRFVGICDVHRRCRSETKEKRHFYNTEAGFWRNLAQRCSQSGQQLF